MCLHFFLENYIISLQYTWINYNMGNLISTCNCDRLSFRTRAFPLLPQPSPTFPITRLSITTSTPVSHFLISLSLLSCPQFPLQSRIQYFTHLVSHFSMLWHICCICSVLVLLSYLFWERKVLYYVFADSASCFWVLSSHIASSLIPVLGSLKIVHLET